MNGKVVVITGASGALGSVVAEAAVARGARVAAVDYAASTAADTPISTHTDRATASLALNPARFPRYPST